MVVMANASGSSQGGAAAASEVLEIVLLQNATLVTQGPERTTSALFNWPPRTDFRQSPCEDPEAFAMTTMAGQVQAGPPFCLAGLGD